MIILYWNSEFYTYQLAIGLDKNIVWYDDFLHKWYRAGNNWEDI